MSSRRPFSETLGITHRFEWITNGDCLSMLSFCWVSEVQAAFPRAAKGASARLIFVSVGLLTPLWLMPVPLMKLTVHRRSATRLA
jgi:hypothetical protein